MRSRSVCALLAQAVLAAPATAIQVEPPPSKTVVRPGQTEKTAPGKTDPEKSEPGKTETEKAKTEVALPTPPQGKEARPLPPVLEPMRSPIERRDLIQTFRSKHRLEGFYRLKTMVWPGGIASRGCRGYLVIGGRYLSLHLYAPRDNAQVNLQAAFREFRIVGDKLVMNSLIGHRNKDNGDIGLEPVGQLAQVRFVQTGGVLRLYRGPGEYLEFERIE